MARLLQLCVACLLIGAGCSRNSTPAAKQSFDWTHFAYSNVIGYSFDAPTNRMEGWTLLSKTGIDQKRLKEWTQSSAKLDGAQARRLIDAAFKSKIAYQFAACYAPRNIFVFYDGADAPVAAIEICFSCDAVATWPEKDCKLHHDFPELAKLSNELGLRVGSEDRLEDYLMVFTERHGN